MSWTTSQVTQNGNQTRDWTITGSALSPADAVVIRADSGSSGMRINHVTVRISPLRYTVQVAVIGGGATAFRFSAEQMD